MAQKNYPDIQISEGDQLITNSRDGFKCKRLFKVTGFDNSTPTASLYNLITAGNWNPAKPTSDIPIRMTPHPTIVIPSTWGAYYAALSPGPHRFPVNNCFCADIITAKGISAREALIEVEYAVLNALTQEPTSDGDGAPALCNLGASVATVTVGTDYGGNSIIFYYYDSTGTPGAYSISQNGIKIYNAGVDPAGFGITVTAQKQVPNTLIRFQRRERTQRDPAAFCGFCNSTDTWTIFTDAGGHAFTPDKQTLLCTRIENQTYDGGLSYVVTYEFQYMGLVSLANAFVATGATQPATGKMSQWQIGGYYVLPGGAVGQKSGGTPPAIGAGQVPPDAAPTLRQIYGLVDFEGQLSLT